MADESFELEDGEVVSPFTNGPSSLSVADIELRAQLDEAAMVLRHRGQPYLARLALCLVDARLCDARWVLDDEVRGGGGDFSGDPVLFDAFRRMICMRLVIGLQETGNDEDAVSEAFPAMVLEATQHAARLVHQTYDIDDGGGFGAVRASAAAVRSLEKQTFRAAGGKNDDDDGITECSICSEEFVDGGQVTVMPCPSGVHMFHPECISKWLTISNLCPLCRHELPAYYE